MPWEDMEFLPSSPVVSDLGKRVLFGVEGDGVTECPFNDTLHAMFPFIGPFPKCFWRFYLLCLGFRVNESFLMLSDISDLDKSFNK